MRSALIAASIAASAVAQQAGHQKSEYHPALNLSKCTIESGCTTKSQSATMDSNWRWTHKANDWHNCYTGTEWDQSVCSDGVACAQNCAVEGIDTNDMKNIYGVSSDGEGLRLNFVTWGGSTPNVGSRMYMMQDDENYEMFKLRGMEFSFDVDVSQLPCGLNGALYFVEMSQNGDKGVGNNEAGAKFGTGYCDAQCPHDIKFQKGVANVENWNSTTAMGKDGICCAEMDIWEANLTASAYTAHPCRVSESTVCDNDEDCGDGDHRYGGICDKDGCDLNPYRAGAVDFYGAGKVVDTNSPFTVVTQFITEDGSADTDVIDIKRFFIQNGKKIEHPMSQIDGLAKQVDSINDDMCKNVKEVFGDQNDYQAKGGMKVMSDSLGRGMVLVMSLWDDHAADMHWLDSTYPETSTHAGALRGPCSIDSGKPEDVEHNSPNSYVKYSNIKVGEIGSTNPDMMTMEFLQ
jgi:cellulose 1,4-beta-cellobiosidase